MTSQFDDDGHCNDGNKFQYCLRYMEMLCYNPLQKSSESQVYPIIKSYGLNYFISLPKCL